MNQHKCGKHDLHYTGCLQTGRRTVLLSLWHPVLLPAELFCASSEELGDFGCLLLHCGHLLLSFTFTWTPLTLLTLSGIGFCSAKTVCCSCECWQQATLENKPSHKPSSLSCTISQTGTRHQLLSRLCVPCLLQCCPLVAVYVSCIGTRRTFGALR